ncbi:hypothetical protein [Succinivibrio dextrinosolvens]|uniref:hypothetical protein n=1 Tax=Succinivibrio dextrinosolvens TaxID=83771 RepID=UPI0019220C1C|nr:hypothetical protein [Succinivibrio dextrinosolvens]
MANLFQKFLYFLSAEIPFFLVLGGLWFYKESSLKATKSVSWEIPVILCIFSLVLLILFIKSFRKIKTELSVIPVTVKDFRSADVWLVGYIITYLLPLVSISWSDITWWLLVIVMMMLILVVTFSDYVTPHPLLFCMGYHFYWIDVEGAASDYIVISKNRVRNPAEFKKVSRVFELLLFRLGDN